ncbi:hypothetical protein O6H91_09G065600 [Diphasiastrum complanatum]|uniref:Uncharacterized protein n=1 Tax=Diphasiastrum complanatum TaxID=34168 RepID=A0ACC2CRB9_DIPCM|nr:hypothetical protein O6H91_09G065600 [Diphasiastrum complanatum]
MPAFPLGIVSVCAAFAVQGAGERMFRLFARSRLSHLLHVDPPRLPLLTSKSAMTKLLDIYRDEFFEPVETCRSEGREDQTIIADLDGTLLRGRSSFPYFLLVALEGGSLLRAIILTLISPLAWALYHFVSEAAGIQILIFFTFAGLRVRDIEAVARAVLPKFYSEDVHKESWRVFSSCGKRYIITANPRIMVEHFAKNILGAHKVLGTEIEVNVAGYATGFVRGPGVLVGLNKRNALKCEFGDYLPDVGLGDRITDYSFMSLCKEAYVVPSKEVAAVPRDKLVQPVVFHDGRLVQRPTPLVALLTFLWLPIGFALAVFRIGLAPSIPVEYVPLFYKLTGIRLIVKGIRPPKPRKELSDRIVPVATSINVGVFHGTTARGWKGMDPFFVFMNPFPTFEVTFLEQLPLELTVRGGKSAIEVANHIQRVLADTLGFKCTNYTRKDKYNMLVGSDGTVPFKKCRSQ